MTPKENFKNKPEIVSTDKTDEKRQKEIEQNIIDILLMSDFGEELLEEINDTKP